MGCCASAPAISEDAEVELSHFQLLRSVGKGAFGKVRIVQHKRTKKTFALKYINKEKCMAMNAVENIIQERKLLEAIQNNFVCNLRYAFQDDENLFMVIDLMLGGDLRFHLDRVGTVSEPMLQLVIAETACGLAYLHSKNIVHRDLKPDNLLLDEGGHCHLTDFNIAVRFRPEKPLTAVAGSMAYMAPEILTKRGYFSTVDWWSLGVVAYELVYGKRPFRSKTNDGLTHAIIHDEVVLPTKEEKAVSDPLRDLLLAFMTRDISKRIGTVGAGGFDALKEHPFLKSLDWPLVLDKKYPPTFVPDPKKANFDATHELEELLLEDNPLKARPRKKKTERIPKEKETPEQRLNRIMDDNFIVFDYTKVNPGDSKIEVPVTEDVYETKPMQQENPDAGSDSPIKDGAPESPK